MLLVNLYFGRDVPARQPVSNVEFSAFARDEITPRFPDGFTVFDAKGQWLDPGTGRIGAEQSIVVQIASPENAGLAARVTAVAEAYRRKFHQQAVGITTTPVCGVF